MRRTVMTLTALAILTPANAHAHDWKFCLAWSMQQSDGDAGEDHHATTTTMKARGVYVGITHPNWILPFAGYADEDDGCFEFTANETSNFTVHMFAETKLGATSNITIQAFENYGDSTVPSWVMPVSPNKNGGTVQVFNSPGDLSNLIAWSTFVVYWIDHLTSPRLAGTRSLVVYHDECRFSAGSCQISTDVFIDDGTTPNSSEGSDKKFLIAHEVGHWLEEMWTGWDFVDDEYGYAPPTNSPPECKYSGVGDHALRSQEWGSAAFSEGFAHFLSTLAFNDHDETAGFFRYYKDLSALAVYQDLEDDDWIVAVENPGSVTGGWMAEACDNEVGTAVELDWLRHYWDFRTNTGAKPTHWQVFEQIRHGRDAWAWAEDTAYLGLSAALTDADLGLTPTQQDALFDRWVDSGEWNGIDQ